MIRLMNEKNLDIVTGTRYEGEGGIYGWSFFRKLTSRVANFITTEVLDAHVSDFTGSFRIYKREVFEALIKQVENRGYAFQMEIAVRAAWKGYKIGEFPIVFVDRVYGKSKLGPNEIYLYLHSVWQLFNASR